MLLKRTEFDGGKSHKSLARMILHQAVILTERSFAILGKVESGFPLRAILALRYRCFVPGGRGKMAIIRPF